jgi:peptidoglycan/LPS O-acetylase OafA/YrhL
VQKAAASLGRCSLGIYLIHWLIIEFLMDYLPTAAKTLMPVTALAVLLLSWGLTWCLLRVPVVQNLFTAAPAWVGRRQTAAAGLETA